VTYTEPNTDRIEVPPFPVNYRRFRAALDLRGLAVEDIARSAQVSSRHIWFVLHGQRRPSATVEQAIRDALGPDGWAFATGQSDTLRDDSPAAEVQP
jgi:transcriptional regulator with XRE-family HTH domain